jgi:hypothetical protein
MQLRLLLPLLLAQGCVTERSAYPDRLAAHEAGRKEAFDEVVRERLDWRDVHALQSDRFGHRRP